MNQLPEDDGSHTSGIQPARSSPTTKKRAPTTTDECYPHLTKKQKVIFVHKANAATGSFPPAFAPAPTPKPPSESANPYKARQPLTVQEMLDMRTVGALDVRNQCSGFVYAVSVADQFIKTGMYKNILVIGAEYHSGGLDKTTRGRGVSVIFGDGAGAAVLTREEDNTKGILSTHLHSEGKHARELVVEGPSIMH